MLGLTPLLSAYRDSFPNVKLRLTLLHRPVDLVDEGFDVGIVVPRLVNSGTLINRPLFKVTPVVVAAPGYLARTARRRVPPRSRSTRSSRHRPIFTARRGRSPAHPATTKTSRSIPAYTVNNSQMLRQAAICGMGITVLPESHVARDIESGALVRLLPGFAIKDADKEVSLVYPGRRHVSAKTRSFVDFTLAYFRERRGGRRSFSRRGG